ncbi:HAD-IA family hydrolase [Pseudalkalibacillus hwajinpoensis]|uniref:HAD family hydrolase n=1 Tax=Guptibacillus hwajinpoensis TaxID=208199 RepID=A0A4U1MLL8_9BACL|nr:HAD-IA family hydrolase [Pseudalkalibacillus hwajinpoensis]TKD71442.1 HAD family hydrolase [Pseudalkalibacillus hwajinpoensis]
MRILWDFDGTLFDTYPAFTRVMRELVPSGVKEEDILKELKVSFHHAASFFNLSKKQIETFREMDNALSPDDKPPFPGLKDILEKAELNVIMTHKPRAEVTSILKHFNMEHYFKDLVAGDDGYPRKPDASSYRYLHKKHNLDLAVGDRVLDILPAKEIGLKTCLFQNSAQGADLYVTNYKDLSKLLWPTSK